MDERTRRSDDELAPNLRRTTPEPDVISLPSSKLRVGSGSPSPSASSSPPMRSSTSTARRRRPIRALPRAGVQSVGAATIAPGNIRVMVNALGTVTPIATVTVQTQISGQLTGVGFTEGQLVKRATSWRRSMRGPMRSPRPKPKANWRTIKGFGAGANRPQALSALLPQNSIARQQADDQAFMVQQDEGTVKLDQAQVDAQALNIAYCHIVSPVTGRIGLRLVDPGNYVQTRARPASPSSPSCSRSR